MSTIRYHEVRKIVSIKDMLNSSVNLFSDRPAFWVKKEKGESYSAISYSTLKKNIDALGTKLIDMGLKDSKIAMIGENCYEWMVSYFATVMGTGVAVPLDKELPTEELQSHVKTAECDTIFYTNSYKHHFDNIDIQNKINLSEILGEVNIGSLITQGEELVAEGDKRFIDAQVDPDDLLEILFTSGTSENSKGVMLTHRNVATNLMSTSQICKIYPEDKALSILPIHHTFENSLGIQCMLYNGASIAFCEGLKHVAKNIVEAKTSLLVGVPLIFESIFEKIWKQAEKTGKDKKLKTGIALSKKLMGLGIDIRRKLFKEIHEKFGGNLRMIITGAAAINPNAVRGFEDFGIKVLLGYGLTECSPLVCGTPDTTNTYNKAGSVGPAIPGVEVRIIDKNEEGIGEVICRGGNVMTGYYKDPDRTAQVIKDGWFHTGDLGFFDKQEYVYLTGRKKNVIVTKNGKNIYPEEVEFYLNRSHYIEESLVEGILEEKSDDVLVKAQIRPAYDVIYEEFGENIGDEEVNGLIKKIIAEFNEKMPIYKRIRGFNLRKEEFIMTTTKKIKRHANLAGKE